MYRLLMLPVLALLLISCSDSQISYSDGDSNPDGDATPDGDITPDGDAIDGDGDRMIPPEDGDTHDGVFPDGDVVPDGDTIPDGDPDYDDFDGVDGDLDDDFWGGDEDRDPFEIDMDPEPDLEIDEEHEVVPPALYIMEDFPFDTTTIDCPELQIKNMHLPSNLVWGDGAGTVFFGGMLTHSIGRGKDVDGDIDIEAETETETGETIMPTLFIYDESSDTLSCDSEIREPIFAMDGSRSNDETTLWLLLLNRLARRDAAGNWSYVSIPDATGELADTLMYPKGLSIGPDGWIAVWDYFGFGFYNTGTQQWITGDLPSLTTPPLVTTGAWDDGTFLLPMGCTIYRYDPTTEACTIHATLSACDETEGDSLYVTHADDSTIWLARMQHVNEPSPAFAQLLATYTLDRATAAFTELAIPQLNDCREDFDSMLDPMAILAHQLPGMGGPLPVFHASGMIYNHSGMMCNIHLRMHLAESTDSPFCSFSAILSSSSWFVGMSGGCYGADNMGMNGYAMVMALFYWSRAWRDGDTIWLANGSRRLTAIR